MTVLTDSERDIVEQHLDIPRSVARRLQSRWIDFEERYAEAYHALCLVAKTYTAGRMTGGGTWATYTYRACLNRVLMEIRRRRCRQRYESRVLPMESQPVGDLALVDAADEAEFYRNRFGRLSAKERMILDLYCAGETWSEIGRMLGIARQDIRKIVRRVSRKLTKVA
ncbi:MAG: sigma-70 family RNA polymerase sigma factor [Cyanobacteria bacterium REEB65]|nr:sigma-70 family RNA polymerase sigma factor [Cyanobacteria bacterium REEB65]